MWKSYALEAIINIIIYLKVLLLIFIHLCYNYYVSWIWDLKENAYAHVKE
jgi:hypothetical protein